ncbi:MAG: M16 family metallopeptidase [Myxococcota bacterium]
MKRARSLLLPPVFHTSPKTMLLASCLLLGLGGYLLLSPARALENGPLAIQEMLQPNGLMVLVAPQPALPTFTATLHYQIGSAHEWRGLYGVTELLADLLMDPGPGSRNPAFETTLLGQLDQVDTLLRFKRQALADAPASTALNLQIEISSLETQLGTLQQQLAANSVLRLSELLYLERGASRPRVSVSPSEVQVTLTLPSDQLSFFMASERLRMLTSSTRGFYGAREKLAQRRTVESQRPGTRLLNSLLATTFQTHPFGRPSPETPSIRHIAREEAEQFARLMLRPSLSVIALAGGVRTDEVRTLAAQYLGDIPRSREPEPIHETEPRQQGLRRVETLLDAPSEVLMAFPRTAAGLPAESPLLPILAELLQDERGGLLAPLKREGLASTVTAVWYPAATPFGTLQANTLIVGAQAAPSTSYETLESRLLSILSTLAEKGPDDEALEAARRRVITRLDSAFLDPSQLAPMMARAYAQFKQSATLNLLYQRIHDVSSTDVKTSAAALFAPENTSIGILHPKTMPSAHAEESHDDGHASREEAAHADTPKADGHGADGHGADTPKAAAPAAPAAAQPEAAPAAQHGEGH